MRRVEIFTAGCPVCDGTVAMVRELACPDCEIEVLDMRREEIARHAGELGIRSVPAVAIDGRLAACCVRRGPDPAQLRAAGSGRPGTG